MKLCTYIIFGLFTFASCLGMEECPGGSQEVVNGSNFGTLVRPAKMNFFQVVDCFTIKRGTIFASPRFPGKQNLLYYLQQRGCKMGAPFGILEKSYPIFNFNLDELKDLARQERETALKQTTEWLKNFFPTGNNDNKLQKTYGTYEFNYGKAPCNGFYMSISSLERKNFVFAVLCKSGEIALFQLGRHEWHYGDMYYNKYSINFCKPTAATAHPRKLSIM